MKTIELHPTQRDDLQTLENLMQFYTYDLSEWLPLSLADHGFFSLQALSDYWRNPAIHPFVIHVNGELAGFVTVDNATHLPGAEHNIGYLFIARRFRGQGVATFVASTLLSRFHGQWQILHLAANLPAAQFWKAAIPRLTADVFSQHHLIIDANPCIGYRFASSPPVPAPLPF
jgi:predicted acetyltransferase